MSGDLATTGAVELFDNGLPATLYAQLHTGDPGTNGTSNVATENTRASFTRTAASAGPAGFVSCSNDTVVEWLNAAADETVTHLTVWTASSGGVCVFVDNCPDAVIASGETIQIQIGDLVMRFPVWA